MSYIINKTDGTLLTTVLDGTTDTSTGLTLIGRNYPGYGLAQNENFVKLLENFADATPPGFTPLPGTLWWDTANVRLKIYNGTEFISVSPIVDSATQPTATNQGDLWWDTANQQLRSWNGSNWVLIGPAYTASQGLTGPIVETFYDNGNNPHTVVVEYAGGYVVSVQSHDNFILGATTHGFNFISSGINLPGNKVVQGNSTVQGFSLLGSNATFNGQIVVSWLDSNQLPQAGPAIIPGTSATYDLGSNSEQFRNIYLSGDIFLSGAKIDNTAGALALRNTNASGNVDIYVNTTSGTQRAVYVNGATGLLYVSANPVDPLGVATKGYVDTAIAGVNSTLAADVTAINANVTALSNLVNTEYTSTIATLTNNVNRIDQNDVATNARITSLTNVVSADESSNATNFGSLNSSIATINSAIALLAPINTPVFTGTPTAPTPSALDNSTAIATTAFVRANAAVLAADYNSKITALTTTTAVNLTNGLAIKANINSPAFTGTPTSPTPSAGDNSTAIATTAYVNGAISTQKFNYTVSANPPSGGNNGDFWFQVG